MREQMLLPGKMEQFTQLDPLGIWEFLKLVALSGGETWRCIFSL